MDVNALYENLLEKVLEGVLVVDQHNRIVTVNQGFSRVFETDINLPGLQYDEFVQSWQAKTGNSGYIPLIINALAQKTEYKAKEQTVVLFGRLKHLTEDCYLLRGKQGEVQGAMLITRDETEVQEMRKHLGQVDKFASVGQLAAGLAHEIRNPMTSLKGFTQMLMQQGRNECDKEMYQIMIDDLDRINNLITEYLQLAKPSVPHRSVCDLTDVLEKVVFLLYSEAALKEVRLAAEFGSEKALVYGDANQLKQVFLNIIRNALEASGPGAAINVSISGNEGFLEAKVTDEGSGISPEIKGRIFEPFFTTKDTGTGLGLAISCQILKSYGGDINFTENPSGLGVTCSVRLPAVRPLFQSSGQRLQTEII